MSLSSPSVPELFSACTELFGSHVQVSVDFLKYLEPSGIKAAYRERVFETHPDRARLLGIPEDKLAEHFKKISSAYEILSLAIRDKGRFITENKETVRGVWSKSGASKPQEKDHPHFSSSRVMPRRPLRIGQFMFYSGFISWHSLIDAIVWQRKNRPLIGRIARSWNLLTEEEIGYILKHKAAGEKFGEYALRKGLLTRGNLMALLGKQAMFAKPLGAYFIDKGILTPLEVERLVRRQHRHNEAFESNRHPGFQSYNYRNYKPGK